MLGVRKIYGQRYGNEKLNSLLFCGKGGEIPVFSFFAPEFLTEAKVNVKDVTTPY